MFCILFVLHDNERLEEILNAWEEAGAPGVTILPSSGLERFRNSRPYNEDMPLLPSLDDFFNLSEVHNSTLFSVVSDEQIVDRIVAATEKVTGDLNQPDSGILFVLPVARAYGLHRKPRT